MVSCNWIWFVAVIGEGRQRRCCLHSVQWWGTFAAKETVGKTAMSRCSRHSRRLVLLFLLTLFAFVQFVLCWTVYCEGFSICVCVMPVTHRLNRWIDCIGVARCVSNSQLAHDFADGFSRKIENWTCWVELCRAVCTNRRRQQLWPSFQFCSQLDWIHSQHGQFSIFWQSLSWTSCEFNTYCMRLVGGMYWICN